MENFLLDKWLKNKSRKVVTRNGKPVRIVCWNSPNKKFPIVGFIDNKEEIFEWNHFGYCRKYHIGSDNDLFFADDENKLKEFEKVMIQFSHERNSLIQFNHTTNEINAHLHLYSETLLNLARKELQIADYTNGYIQGKQDTLKSLPKWKKAEKDEELDCHVAIQQDGRVVLSDFVQKDEYYITLDVLKTLPKEE